MEYRKRPGKVNKGRERRNGKARKGGQLNREMGGIGLVENGKGND